MEKYHEMKHLRNFKLFELSLPKLFKKDVVRKPKSEKGPEGESTYVEFYYGDTFCILTNLKIGGEYTLEVYGDGTDLEVLLEEMKEKEPDFDRVSVSDERSSIRIVKYHRELHIRPGSQTDAEYTIAYGNIAYVMCEGLPSYNVVDHLRQVDISSTPVEGGVRLQDPIKIIIYIPFSEYKD